MFFSTASILALIPVFSAAFAGPVAERAVPKHFKLQTKIVNNTNDCGTFKGKLYVTAWHTGAGYNDAVLLNNVSNAAVASMNGTQVNFDLGSQPPIPWGMLILGDTNYAAWEPVQINAGPGSSDLRINATGLQWNQTYDGFGGWMACDWIHDIPQLFARNQYFSDGSMPRSCSLVDLVVISA